MSSSKRSLKEILDSEYVEDSEEGEDVDSVEIEEQDDKEENDPSMCNECKDMNTDTICNDCEENFCGGCFEMIHRGGKDVITNTSK